MKCTTPGIACELEKIAHALADSGPSGFEIAVFVVSIFSVLVSAGVAIAALRVASAAKNLQSKALTSELEREQRIERRHFADAALEFGQEWSDKFGSNDFNRKRYPHHLKRLGLTVEGETAEPIIKWIEAGLSYGAKVSSSTETAGFVKEAFRDTLADRLSLWVADGDAFDQRPFEETALR